MLTQSSVKDPTQVGKGNWSGFEIPLEEMYAAAEEWRQVLAGVTHPWLCWNVSDRWCLLQQRLVQHIGWTPVIGYDPRQGPPKNILPGSIFIDFNRRFNFGIMLPHFPLEFAFLYTDRIAFWHSDLLCTLDVMQKLKVIFESLPDGAMAAVADYGGRRNWLRFRHHRYWELVGCTTRGASRSQFEHGSGWWRFIDSHPNVPNEKERKRRRKYYYDHGVGTMYWKRNYGGKVVNVPHGLVAPGHCTSINRENYQWSAPGGEKNMTAEIDRNFSIEEVAKDLGIAHLLDSTALIEAKSS